MTAFVAGSVVAEGADKVLGDALHRLVGRDAGEHLQEDRVIHHDAALAARRRGTGGSAGLGCGPTVWGT